MYPTQYENRKRANKVSKFVQPLKPEDNEHIDFIKYDSNSSSNHSDTPNAVEIIKSIKLALNKD